MTRFTHRNSFILRAPFLPIDAWNTYRERAVQLQAGKDNWHGRAMAAREMFQQPRINEAIYLASPGLHTRMQLATWQTDEDSGRKLLLAFERYLNRMCFRCTPFGLFSTVVHGAVLTQGNGAVTAFAGDGTGFRKARIDAALLHKLCAHVVASHWKHLRYLSNRSVYSAHRKLKYVDWAATSEKGRNYQLSEVDSHPVVSSALGLAEQIPQSLGQLGEALSAAHPEIGADVAQTLVADLVEAKLLLPTLSIDLLSNDSAYDFVDKLAALPGTEEIRATLLEAMAELARVNVAGDITLEDNLRLSTKLRAAVPGLAHQQCLRIDSFRAGEQFVLGQGYASALIDDLGLLLSRFSERDYSLDNVARRFEQSYGKGAIPLTEFLENEGLSGSDDHSYTHEMLRQFGIDVPVAVGGGSGGERESAFDRFLVGKLLQGGDGVSPRILHFTRAEVQALSPRGRELPDNLFAILTVLDEGTGESTQAQSWLHGMSHSDIGAWVGRFAYGDENLNAMLRTMAQQQQADQPDCLHAEICYRPADDVANILTRPTIWPYRINLVEGDDKPAEHEIPLADIMVYVAGRELQLWSRKFNQRIIPHMSSAHNAEHSNSIKAYALLRRLARSRHIAHLGWSGSFLNHRFLPRIAFENIILAPARWLIEPRYFDLPYESSDAEGIKTLDAYLQQQGVPQLVELKEGDNTLLLDRHDELDLEQLFRIFKRKRRLALREVVSRAPAMQNSLIRHEVLLPFAQADRRASPPAKAPSLARDLPMAEMSKVVFVKIYLAAQDADQFLTAQCGPLVQRLRAQGLLQDWFFIRYNDPEHHLRLRIFLPERAMLPCVMGELVGMLEQQQSSGDIRRFIFAPYEREMLRYGGTTLMGISEQLFSRDSDACLALLPLCDAGQEERLRAAVWACDALLVDGDYDLAAKHRIVSRMAENYRAEFRIGSYQRGLLGKHFRKHGAQVLLLGQGEGRRPAWAQTYDLATRAVRCQRAQVFARAVEGGVDIGTPDFEHILRSHLHMTCIRLFVSHPRGYEVLVYDMLERVYRSALGRSEHGRAKA